METTDRDGDVAQGTRDAHVVVGSGDEREPEPPPPDSAESSAPVVTPAATAPGPAVDDPHGLGAAVDGLTDLTSAPVHTHPARYHQVHTLLQDALSEADRGGTASR